jgi:hypothetical protein
VKNELSWSTGVMPNIDKAAAPARSDELKLYLIIGLKYSWILPMSTKCLLFYKTILIYSEGL